ncbi:MAG: LacI family DNA-binding transcriptional regulator [Planctomycetota bacterium]
MRREIVVPASMQDVANLAEVSISTVSRVLNRQELVKEQTRRRVESAIRALRYRPNAFARGLMLRRSEIVGLALPDMHGEFYSDIIRGANIRARELGYHLVVSSGRDGDDSRALLQTMQQRTLLDGIAIMISEMTDLVQESLASFTRPLVVLDCDIDNKQHDTVLIDQRHGTLAMMHHLVNNRQVQRVIFVGGLKTNVDTIKRLEACEQVLAETGLSLAAGDVYHLDYQYDTAYDLALERVRSWTGAHNCVFAANDEMAAGIVAAAKGSGVQVPQDLAVVGFDDTRIARMTRPPLTTVRVPTAEMGARAVELLCQRISEPDRPATRVMLKPELIVRASCGSEKVGSEKVSGSGSEKVSG